ncbi:MAG: hypothetical protein KKD18_00610 [Nanoarchaeota archaeon]|nr:hypothetical protein [Nanoarchaeota archaeon]MBU0976899.1 hypothetical protein [Nanoarchaeota archaeon]
MTLDAHIAHCCRRFGKKIIVEAIRNLQNRPRASEGYRTALNWISDRNGSYHLPFGQLCELLDYNPQAIREGLVKIPKISKKLTPQEKARLLDYDN